MIISLITIIFPIHFDEKYFHIESISTPHYDRRDLRSTSKRKNSSASSAAIEDQSRRKIWNSRGSSSNLIEKGFFYSFQNLGG
jgi:hypothetical protein